MDLYIFVGLWAVDCSLLSYVTYRSFHMKGLLTMINDVLVNLSTTASGVAGYLIEAAKFVFAGVSGVFTNVLSSSK